MMQLSTLHDRNFFRLLRLDHYVDCGAVASRQLRNEPVRRCQPPVCTSAILMRARLLDPGKTCARSVAPLRPVISYPRLPVSHPSIRWTHAVPTFSSLFLSRLKCTSSRSAGRLVNAAFYAARNGTEKNILCRGVRSDWQGCRCHSISEDDEATTAPPSGSPPQSDNYRRRDSSRRSVGRLCI